MTLSRVAIGVVCSLVCAWAQMSSARVTGVVTDPRGAVVPNAQVVIVNRATGVASQAVSNVNGIYTVSFLTPGPYEMTIEAGGLRCCKLRPLRLIR